MKTPQNCRSPTLTQRFITAIKNVTEKKKKKAQKLNQIIVSKKLTTTVDGWWGVKRKKNPKEYTEQVKTKE